MNINALITDMAEAIAQSADVLAWANLYYKRDHRVFVNFDMENPPGESYCPYAVIYPESKLAGQTIQQRAHVLHVVTCVYDDSSREYPGINNIIEYEGLQRAEAFRKLVETAMAGVDIGNGVIDFNIEYDPISDFPFLWCGMAVTITEPVTMGSEYLN